MTFMQKLNALIKLGLALALFAGIAHAQSANNGYPYSSLSGAPTVVPTLQGTTYYTATAASVASVTTASYTPYANGDLIVVNCRMTSSGVTGSTITSSPAETFHALTYQSNSTAGNQMAWAVLSSGAAHTFTCSPSASTSYIGVIVLDYSNAGTTLNTSAGGAITVTTFPVSDAYPSASITTTQRTLNVYCGGIATTNIKLYPGNINGSIGRIVGTDGPYPRFATGNTSWCEDYISTGVITTTADVLINSSIAAAGTLAAFNY
jgi:hypothetical protein